ncbi:MAG TPA: hypothetical protein DC017_03465 [Candidatus Wallbacteria bacterium]|nr:hypothetical protein [Candidatus Wallbacteria bacterium]
MNELYLASTCVLALFLYLAYSIVYPERL